MNNELDNFENLKDKLLRKKNSLIEKSLLTALEVLLGRVPNERDMREDCDLKILPNGHEEYHWKGILICETYIDRSEHSFAYVVKGYEERQE